MSVPIVSFHLASETRTCQWARWLAAVLPPTIWIALIGPLGSGKTRIVQELAVAKGVPRRTVTSPTFVLCQTYEGSGQRIIHVDAYRISSESEWWELGAAEWECSSAWVLVEWADRVLAWFPDQYLTVEIEITGPTSRSVRVTGRGTSAEKVVGALAGWSSGPILDATNSQ